MKIEVFKFKYIPFLALTMTVMACSSSCARPGIVSRLNTAGKKISTTYTGGNLISVTNKIDTFDVYQPLPEKEYQKARTGEFTYTIKNLKPNQSAQLRLHFAEIEYTEGGKRRFNVFVNGVKVLNDFDIWGATALSNRAMAYGVYAKANANGKIIVEFKKGSAGLPLVNFIETTTYDDNPVISIDVLSNRHPISKYVYGQSLAPNADYIKDAGVTISRFGGNSSTCYNWAINATNLDFDWFFMNSTWGGEGGKDIFEFTKNATNNNCDALITIPMVNWVAKDTTSYSYSIKKYGKQEKAEQWHPDMGNGKRVKEDGSTENITDNDPHDAYIPLLDEPKPMDPKEALYRKDLITKLTKCFGNAPHFYAMDNEPEIWQGTHQDIHGMNAATYEEMRDVFLKTARKVKEYDPKAIVTGPVVSGWWWYWNVPDKKAHNNVDYMPWWIDEIAKADKTDGKRTLDVLDIHYYPDIDNNNWRTGEYNDDALMRTADTWGDPSYISEAETSRNPWTTFTQPTKAYPAIIPRFRAMVNTLYPGTDRLFFSEWAYGGSNGKLFAQAIAETETYAIMGRDRAYGGTRWTSPDKDTPMYQGLKLLKNFGTESVEAVCTGNPRLLTSYAALSSNNKNLTLLVFNRDQKSSHTAKIGMNGFQADKMTAYTITSDKPFISTAPPVSAPSLYTFPACSITMLSFTGSSTASGYEWDINPDTIEVITGKTVELHPKLLYGNTEIKLLSIDAEAGIKMTISDPVVSSIKQGTVAVKAGQRPGFYRYTMTAKDNRGIVQKQSGWIVVGVPGALP